MLDPADPTPSGAQQQTNYIACPHCARNLMDFINRYDPGLHCGLCFRKFKDWALGEAKVPIGEKRAATHNTVGTLCAIREAYALDSKEYAALDEALDALQKS